MEQLEVNKESLIGDPNNTSLFRLLTAEQKICFPIPPKGTHLEYKQSKNGGIDPADVVYIMGKNNVSDLILPTLRRHKTAVFMILWLSYSLFWMLYYYYPAWRHVHF
jgi:hypothetical protein